MQDSRLLIRPFAPADQAAARRLILTGLGEHFGFIDETRNPDIDDIVGNYLAPGHAFLIAELNGQIVGTGALISEDAGARATNGSENAGTQWQPASERSERECGNPVSARAAPRSGPQAPAPAGAQTGRIVRMSVARDMRRAGIGWALMARLMQLARERGFIRLVLETNSDWDDAIGFYRHCGFRETARGGGGIHLALDLTPRSEKERDRHLTSSPGLKAYLLPTIYKRR